MKEVRIAVVTSTIGLLLQAYFAISELIVQPRNTETMTGQMTFLNCSTSETSNGVMWYYFPVGAQDSSYIYFAGKLQSAFQNRFHLEKQSEPGEFNLVIHSVQNSDAGKYICQEEGEHGQHKAAELIVLEAGPSCNSPVKEDGFVGPNSCGLATEDIQVTCDVTFHGNVPPIIQWRKDGGNPITHLANQTNESGSVTSTLTLSSEMMNQSPSYVCQTRRSAIEQYGCTVKAKDIKIIYAYNNFSVAQMREGQEATCLANSSQLCTYKWIWNNDGQEVVVSNNYKVTLQRLGSYRCEAECAIRNKECLVVSGQVQVSSLEEGLRQAQGSVTSQPCENNDTTPWKISVFMTFSALLITIAAGITALVRVYRRESRKDKEINELKEQRRKDGAPLLTKSGEDQRNAQI